MEISMTSPLPPGACSPAQSAVPEHARIFRRARLARHRSALSARTVGKVVRTVALEMVFLVGGRDESRRNRRFAISQIQQIAMYVCHVVLRMPMDDVAAAFGCTRTTVGHACARVEDRRDNPGFDALVGAIERVVSGVFLPAGRTP